MTSRPSMRSPEAETGDRSKLSGKDASIVASARRTAEAAYRSSLIVPQHGCSGANPMEHRAACCLQRADEAIDPMERKAWYVLALEWLRQQRLAENFEK